MTDRQKLVALLTNLSEIVELSHIGLKNGLDIDLVLNLALTRTQMASDNPLNAGIVGWSEDEFLIARNALDNDMVLNEEFDPS